MSESTTFPSLSFTKTWTSTADFPTYEDSETQVRADMQELHDQTKAYINDELVPAMQAFADTASPKLAQAHEHANKTLLDSYDQTNANLTDAVTKKHEHANAAALDTIPTGGVSNDQAETSETKIPTCAAMRAAIDEASQQAGNLPAGGYKTRSLVKKSDANYDLEWVCVPPVGTVLMWAGASGAVPDGYLLCDGTAASRTTYPLLFAALGTAFGNGDGSTTFNLPDLSDKFVLGAGTNYERGATGGEVNHTLTVSEMPVHTHECADGGAHTHTMEAGGEHTHSVTGYEYTQTGSYDTIDLSDGKRSSKFSLTAEAAGEHTHEINEGGTHSHTIANAGGGNAHNNMPPYIALAYIIRAA